MISHALGATGCAALPAHGVHGQPRACTAPVEIVGLREHRPPGRPVEAWVLYACRAHADELPLLAARELLPRDVERLAAWRAGTTPAPYAVAPAAVAVLARARTHGPARARGY